jgi:hypothetical protein
MSSTFTKESSTLQAQNKSATTSKSKKGKQFVAQEEKVLYISFAQDIET